METMQLDDTELRETAKQLYESYSTVLSESKLASILQDALGDFAPVLDFQIRRTEDHQQLGDGLLPKRSHHQG